MLKDIKLHVFKYKAPGSEHAEVLVSILNYMGLVLILLR